MADIRLATFEDLPAILAISNWAAEHTAANFAVEPETLESWQRDWRETHEMFPWVVAAAVDGEAIGFAKASPWKGRCAYNWTAETTVYVHPGDHGRGVGKALYEGLITILQAQGYRTLLGGITVPNPASVRLHEALGFRRVALLEQVGWKFGRWHDVGYWELKLLDEASAPVTIRPVAEVISNLKSQI
ncbi:MAG: GNAT family N-acetyltransferase [Planctomycetota bacterium]|jgi:phosphinothricin acetyltransferase